MTEPQHRAAEHRRPGSADTATAPEPVKQPMPPIPGLAVRRKAGLGAIQAPFGQDSIAAVAAHRGGAGASAAQGVGALAYAGGSEIHVGGDGGGHVPHEAWHVVQQGSGRALPSVADQDEAARDGYPGPNADVQL